MQDFTKYLEPGSKVLDLGCGSGRDSFYLAEHGYRVWGIDISRVAIERAKVNLNSYDIDFKVASAEELDFEDNFFDAVYSGWVLQSVPLKKAASEIKRVLKPGGVAYLAFLLNTVFSNNGKRWDFHARGNILSAYKDFELIARREYRSIENDNKEPHSHDALIIVVKN
jgi:ubiquinone/menaquinone biosynthesis C-methylase UbiE